MIQRKPVFVTDSALAEALKTLLANLDRRLELEAPLNVFLAGGMAVHLYTGSRVTTDVDAEFAARVHIPADVVVTTTLVDGSKRTLYFDTNYNSSFALMHEDYQEDSIPLDMGSSHLRLNVLSPVDLAVSKIARFADNDKQDIEDLVRLGLTTAAEIEARANEALINFVGGKAMLNANLRDAVALARRAESRSNAAGISHTTPPTLGGGALKSATNVDQAIPVQPSDSTLGSRPKA